MNNIDTSILIISILIVCYTMYIHRLPGVCEFDAVLNNLRKDAIKIEPDSTRLEFFPSDESYTEDKKRVFLCLKDKEGKYYEYNHLLQVLVHELAHAFTDVIDKEHKTPEFNNKHNEYRQKLNDLKNVDPKLKNIVNLDDRVPLDYCRP